MQMQVAFWSRAQGRGPCVGFLYARHTMLLMAAGAGRGTIVVVHNGFIV